MLYSQVSEHILTIAKLKKLRKGLEARFIVYEDEREVIATYVSTCGLIRKHIMTN